MPFATGFGLGVMVLPLTFVVGAMLGGGTAALLVFVAATAGAMTLPPVSGQRAAGVLTGILTAVGAGFTLLSTLLADATIG